MNNLVSHMHMISWQFVFGDVCNLTDLNIGVLGRGHLFVCCTAHRTQHKRNTLFDFVLFRFEPQKQIHLVLMLGISISPSMFDMRFSIRF